MLLRTIICTLSFLGLAGVGASDVGGRIEWNEACTGLLALGHAQVVLDDGGRWSTGIRRDGLFNLRNVDPGEYLLSVLAHDHIFDQSLVLVRNGSEPVVMPSILGTLPATALHLPYPIALSPRRKDSYYVARESFNVVGMFKNPMMLMMVFAGVMLFATPYLMKNLDPETAREVQERHTAMANVQGSIQNMSVGQSLASIFGGGEEDESAKKTAGQPRTPNAPRSKGKPRRK